jgi:Neurotransmitter-gated ion-channel ligand binding domain
MKIIKRKETNFQVQKRQRFPQINARAVLFCLGLLPTIATGGQGASTLASVQELTGYIDAGEREVYQLPNLRRGDTLYIYMQRLSGSLDPLFAVAGGQFKMKMFDDQLQAKLKETPHSPFNVFRDLLDTFYLAWDDDSGKGTDAALKFSIPADGAYKVVVAGSRQPAGRQVMGLTFGGYRLLIGVNAPQVLTGQATPTGAVIATLEDVPSARPRIQEISGKLTPENDSTHYRLADLDPGTTLYVRVEATSGDLKPALTLRNYGNKTLRVDNWQQLRSIARLQYTFKEEAHNFSLGISGTVEQGQKTSGRYRLLIGLNAPEVSDGKGQPVGRPLLRQPIQVGVGIRMDQITEINQRGENFGVVGDLSLAWEDPAFAFNPDTCQCTVKVFDSGQFEKFVAENHLRWPRFIFFNQQGKRWTQGEVFRIYPDGKVTYYERFSAMLQAPDFNFRRFPLDTQQFFIRLQCLNPEENYQFTDLPELTGIGKQLGEEEWYVTKHDNSVSSVVIAEDTLASQFSFRFLCQRHHSYYIFRIFVPLLLIVAVSWVAFFLKDYAKRVDISGANLLVFIAFNFTIGSDLPRLGYLTLLDTMLIVAFVVTTLTVICNVVLKRLDAAGKTYLTQQIDTYILWGYPIFYVVGFFLLALLFFY